MCILCTRVLSLHKELDINSDLLQAQSQPCSALSIHMHSDIIKNTLVVQKASATPCVY